MRPRDQIRRKRDQSDSNVKGDQDDEKVVATFTFEHERSDRRAPTIRPSIIQIGEDQLRSPEVNA